jgi:hypothetical protein
MVGKLRREPRLGTEQDGKHRPRREEATIAYIVQRGDSTLSAQKVKILTFPRAVPLTNVILSSYHQMECTTLKKITLLDMKMHWDAVYRFIHCCNVFDSDHIASLFYSPKKNKKTEKKCSFEEQNVYVQHSIRTLVSFSLCWN